MASDLQTAIRTTKVGGPEALEYVADVPVPTVKSPTDVIVRNEFVGVNFIDTYHRGGLYPLPAPFTVGVEGAGVVVAVGAAVTDVKPGDRVAYLTRPPEGSYASVVRVDDSRVVKVPGGVATDVAAATLLQALTALSLVRIAYEVKPGDHILVHAAAGGTGNLLVQLGVALGAHVIATVSTPEKAEVAKAAGAQDVIIYSQTDFVKEVLRITGGKGVRAVYDGVGKDTFEGSLASLGKLGFFLSFGNASGKVPDVDVLKLTRNSVRLMRTSLFELVSTKEEFVCLAQEALALVEAGKLRINIHKRYPLADAPQAHTDLQSRGTTGKLLLAVPTD